MANKKKTSDGEDEMIKDTPKAETKEAEEQENEKPQEMSELEKLQEELNQANDKYLRLMAEYDNFRKRSAKEKESIYPDAVAMVMTSFLDLADNFERAIAAECSDAEFKKGMELTYKSLEKVFEKLKVEKFGEAGEMFDPMLHNAVMHVDDEEKGSSEIVKVFQKGYKIGDRVLRHAIDRKSVV